MNYCCLRSGVEEPSVAVFAELGGLHPFIFEDGIYKVFYAPELGIKYTPKAFEEFFLIVREW